MSGELVKRNTSGLSRKGRPKGSKNVVSEQIKNLILEATKQLGGLDRLVEWAEESEENERAFWTILLPKLIAKGVEVEGEVKSSHTSVTIVAAFPQELLDTKARKKVDSRVVGALPAPVTPAIVAQVVQEALVEAAEESDDTDDVSDLVQDKEL